MKVIHIAGWSGSGKTTFIRNLVNALAPLGAVGTIKHIGDHVCDLPPGKDTSVHYDAGASIVAGIDCEKTMITRKTISLSSALDHLSNTGVNFTVIEGFKNIPFQKVVIGDLDVPALIRNPDIKDVISLLSSFDDYYTGEGLIKDFGENPDGIIMMSAGNSPHVISPDICVRIEEETRSLEGVYGIRVRTQKPVVHPHQRFFIVVLADNAIHGSNVLTRCMAALQV
jgi:molybdopterin-guanine dinucleotide biosynthesis protein MobB